MERRTYVFQTLLLMLVLSGVAALVMAFPVFRNLLVGKGEFEQLYFDHYYFGNDHDPYKYHWTVVCGEERL